MVKSKRLREAGHVALMVKNRNAYRHVVAKREGHFDDLGFLLENTVKTDVQRWHGFVMNRFDVAYDCAPMADVFGQQRTFGFGETRGICWLALQGLVSGTLLYGISAVLFGRRQASAT
jgi:hypothetical protein